MNISMSQASRDAIHAEALRTNTALRVEVIAAPQREGAWSSPEGGVTLGLISPAGKARASVHANPETLEAGAIKLVYLSKLKG